MFYCYILKSIKNGAYYVGSCENITNRLALHNKLLVPATKRYAPWNLVYEKKFITLKDARQKELKIKSWKKRDATEKLIKTFQNL